MSHFAVLFDESFARATQDQIDGQDFFGAFYLRFLAADARVADRFAQTDMARQRSMLRKSFHHMANFYVSTEVSDYLARIAESHGPGQLNIPPDLFDLWLDTLLGVVRDFDPAYSMEVELAWRVVLAPGLAYMKFARLGACAPSGQ